MSAYVSCGDVLSIDVGTLNGHGTLLSPQSSSLHSTVCGSISRVNKLITVEPIHSRYNPEIGDVIVGRIVEVGDKRWKVEIGARNWANLALSSINLPGGLQRRRTEEDSLNMRKYYVEGDLISAEVQKLQQASSGASSAASNLATSMAASASGGGSVGGVVNPANVSSSLVGGGGGGSGGGGGTVVSLHTRNLKYGKLECGQLVCVPPTLIKRCKYHFQSLPCGVEMILGTNGWIWVTSTSDAQLQHKLALERANGDEVTSSSASSLSSTALSAQSGGVSTIDQLEKVCRVRNCILALASAGIGIWSVTVMDVYGASCEMGLQAKEIRNPEVGPVLTQRARKRKTGEESETDSME